MQDKLEEQYKKVVRLETERSDIMHRLQKTQELNQEITRINQTLEATATSMTDTILPQHKKIMNLKTHVAGLYQRLGCSETNAWYKALLEGHEFENIEPFVTKMVQELPMPNENPIV